MYVYKKSFENVITYCRYLKDSLASDKQIFLFGNKLDIVEKRIVEDADIEKLIEEIKAIHGDNYKGCALGSAKTNENINDFFVKVATTCVSNSYGIHLQEKKPTPPSALPLFTPDGGVLQ